MISEGQTAPDFTLPRDGGATVTLSALRPGKVVLYFYPKDDTPGCTLEAQDFSRLAGDFAAAGAAVLGVSRDSVKSHGKFCAKHGLTIALGADEDGAVTEAYGVWVEKKMYGKTSMGIERATFLIGPDGVIEQVWRKVSAKGHAEAVLQTLRG